MVRKHWISVDEEGLVSIISSGDRDREKLLPSVEMVLFTESQS